MPTTKGQNAQGLECQNDDSEVNDNVTTKESKTEESHDIHVGKPTTNESWLSSLGPHIEGERRLDDQVQLVNSTPLMHKTKVMNLRNNR